MRFIDKLKLTATHAERLYALSRNPVYVEQITRQDLENLGIEAAILDHDGVLGANRNDAPDAAGSEFIRKTIDLFGKEKVFILSNTSSRKGVRRDYYNSLQDGPTYMQANKKPDPEGLMMVEKLCGVSRERIGMFDDGLMTGVLMAEAHGAKAVYTRRIKIDENISARLQRYLTTWPQIGAVSLLAMMKKIRLAPGAGP